MNNKEIEVKFKITSQIKEKILQDLKTNNAKHISTFNLIDTYYIPNFKSFEKDGKTIECVRLREQNNTSVLGYKKIHYEANPVYCDEYETIVSSKEETEKILFALGFTTQMIIDKTRDSYQLNNFRFDFDGVKNLGELLEVELTQNNADIDDIFKFLKKYNLTQKDVTYEGIQVLMKKALQNKK